MTTPPTPTPEQVAEAAQIVNSILCIYPTCRTTGIWDEPIERLVGRIAHALATASRVPKMRDEVFKPVRVRFTTGGHQWQVHGPNGERYGCVDGTECKTWADRLNKAAQQALDAMREGRDASRTSDPKPLRWSGVGCTWHPHDCKCGYCTPSTQEPRDAK